MSRAFAIGQVVYLHSSPGVLMTIEAIPPGLDEPAYRCVWFGRSLELQRGNFLESSLARRQVPKTP
jgi:uncharacterized protein YodC (DUF2158 family)